MFDIFTHYPEISFHTYADDLQLYLNCTDSPNYAPDLLSSCIKSIHQWLTSNSLKLNPTKTQAIFLYLPLRSSTLPEPPPISLDNTTLPYSQHVRNLVFHIDTTLSLDFHLIHMHKSNHYHLHCLRLIQRSITLPIAITITSSYIIPLFDYCNSLLFNLPDYKLIKLQRLQNAVVRCVHSLPRHSPDSITPLLKQQHWLPVPHRIKYKLSLTIHKAIHQNSPDYLPPTSTNTNYYTPDPFLQQLYPYHSPFIQTPFFKYTLLCPLCPLPLELLTQTPKTPSNSIISLPRTADCSRTCSP